MAPLPPGCRQSARWHTTLECCRPRALDPRVLQLSVATIAVSVPDRCRPHREAGSIGQPFLHARKSQRWMAVAALVQRLAQASPALHSMGMDAPGTGSL